VTKLTMIELETPSGDGLLSAACTLGPGAMRARLAERVALRDRCADVRLTLEGAALTLAPDESLETVARLMALESECCGFYRFSLRVSGETHELEIDAGPNGRPAVEALLSIP
jgi:hypothetical protein